jgi:YebC/PmpR family DNA-binding regulatory protein
MSGHSHFKTVMHKKGAEDAKRSKVFSKLSRLISIAARQGTNPEMNPKLKQALEEAKKFHLPKDNIERAIKRGTGELEKGEKLEEVIFEAYGPGNIAIIIEGITDNKNRTLGEVKQILSQNKGKLAGEGSVKWLFERKGCITVNNEQRTMDKEDLELTTIEAGAEDIYWHNDFLDVYTKPENLEKVKKILEEKGIKIESSSLDWVAKDRIEVKEKEDCQKLFEALDENEAVQDIYSNLAN